jgi:hypothetical protein
VSAASAVEGAKFIVTDTDLRCVTPTLIAAVVISVGTGGHPISRLAVSVGSGFCSTMCDVSVVAADEVENSQACVR